MLTVVFPSVMPTSYGTPTVPTPTQVVIHLSAEKLTALVNEWRVSQGFQPYIKDERLCVIAQDRVDDGEDNHQGFRDKYYSYPYVLSENMIFRAYENDKALESWLNSPSHRKALEKPYKYSCIATKDDVAVQIFSNF